ncbi:tRNA pseudouridine(55) synthase TruB [Nitrospirales bacterium NOB]|nr:MAG: tRNA pseudouridine synthase B [Nitrospira sp. OLB3]MBV6468490.1 tRNA pseudouridine synthase B [Nitrospirota bacterium]MCE7965279.1 tRNA pseudouridine(55) synthase TruB [Nitrospira sp. NTP2]MCK6494288.1 tRNA pseudouridine(55) synthase TruB [Nitrospira sp.]MDL1888530.1 tRNA pseudouridine(55) synthase TruB [Nitrospirales bacterium NOB]MEB2339522.1 tRNA pseudouridine(55) synthase TruB [Nitrospirales bacterium]NUN70005.1 tRNA pseudouridine(55) synthase TruB [Bacteroidota bacterium]
MAAASLTDAYVTATFRDGVLNVRKEADWTSHDVVARLRGRLRGLKVGHAGTLDPAATGVLPVLVGRGTRIAEYLVEWDKTYLAELRLGETTDTQDATGTLLSRSPIDGVTEAQVRAIASGFIGRIQQIPPMYSAVKVGGVPLYKAARAGRDVAREAREVTVFRLDLVRIYLPDVTLRVVCSKGTYIRTLCADIGQRLGVGGHMRSLVRERVGPLALEQALTVGELESRLAQGAFITAMLTLDEALAGLPVCRVGEVMARRVMHGMPVPPAEVRHWAGLQAIRTASENQAVRIQDEAGRLLAIGILPPDVEAARPGSSRQPIAVAKVLVTEDSHV